VAYGAAGFTGVQDRLVRARAHDRAGDFDVYADFDPAVAGWADLEIASEGSFGDAAGWGLIVQVGPDGLLRFYERCWNGILTFVMGPALPESGRLRLRWRKGAGVESTLWVDAWEGAGWTQGVASYLVPDDTLRRGLDLAVCNYHGNTRPLRRASCVRLAPPGLLTLAADSAHSADWQVFQRDAQGRGDIPLVFWHRLPDGGTAQARVVSAADGSTLPGHDYADHAAALAPAPAGASATLLVEGVPAGGNYDVHLRLLGPDGAVVAQAVRRDVAVGDVWLAAGQSNMSGYSGNLLGGESPTPRAHLFGTTASGGRGASPWTRARTRRTPCPTSNPSTP
jgi:hypothetical protein